MKLAFSLAAIGISALVFSPALSRAAVTTNPSGAKTAKPEIVSGGAVQSDLHLDWLRDFEGFERAHPAIARDFRPDPRLIRISERPTWSAFLAQNPEIHADIEANPRNYLDLSPHRTYASKLESSPRHSAQRVLLNPRHSRSSAPDDPRQRTRFCSF